jgi:hypothetical protein
VDRGISQEISIWKPWEHGVKWVIGRSQNCKGSGLDNAFCADSSIPWTRLAGDLALGLASMLDARTIVLAGYSMDGHNLFNCTPHYARRGPRPSHVASGSDKRQYNTINVRVKKLMEEGRKVFWIAPGAEMLELLARPVKAQNSRKKG